MAARALSSAQRRILILRRTRLHVALERGLTLDVSHLFDKAARAAGAHAAAGQMVRAEAAAESIASAIEDAILRRGAGVSRTFIAHTFDELARARKDATPANVAQTATLDWLRAHAASRATGIVDTTREIIRSTIASGDEAGIGTAAIARSVRNAVGGAFGLSRANTISRTETHTAANYGSNEAAEATGLELDKEWGATEDERTRPSHAAADGQQVGMDEDFSVGGADLQFPGDPEGPSEEIINCRCVVLYRPKE